MRLRGLTAVHMPPPQPRQLSPGELPARGSDGDARREGAEVSQGQAPGIRGHGNPQPTLPDQGVGPAKTERGTFKVFLPLTALWLVKRKKKQMKCGLGYNYVFIQRVDVYVPSWGKVF